jgi:multicomponent Na+:H+ antiporter subunit D
MVLGISFASTSGLIGTTIHMFNHALIKGGLFMVVACFAVRMGVVNVSNLSGISRRMPWTCFAFTLGGLALIGVPVTAGFISKWYLLIAAFDAGYWIVAAMILLSSLLALVYIWRVVEVAYFGDLPEANEHLQEAPLSMLIPTYAVVGLTILFGVWTSLPAGAATQAVATLLGGAP